MRNVFILCQNPQVAALEFRIPEDEDSEEEDEEEEEQDDEDYFKGSYEHMYSREPGPARILVKNRLKR